MVVLDLLVRTVVHMCMLKLATVGMRLQSGLGKITEVLSGKRDGAAAVIPRLYYCYEYVCFQIMRA